MDFPLTRPVWDSNPGPPASNNNINDNEYDIYHNMNNYIINRLVWDSDPGPQRGSFRQPSRRIVGFRGFDSSTILIQRGGIIMSIGDFPESLSQAMLVGIMLAGRWAYIPACRKEAKCSIFPYRSPALTI